MKEFFKCLGITILIAIGLGIGGFCLGLILWFLIELLGPPVAASIFLGTIVFLGTFFSVWTWRNLGPGNYFKEK